LAGEFAESLDALDELMLMDIYPAREKPIPGVDSRLIAKQMHRCKVSLVDGRDNIIAKLLSDKVEVVLTLGAGSVDQLVTPITEALSKKTSPASA
jgi:UDP-N-acetylmuramate--alanine ligase